MFMFLPHTKDVARRCVHSMNCSLHQSSLYEYGEAIQFGVIEAFGMAFVWCTIQRVLGSGNHKKH